MIISASRRTDIPAYYSEWFMNRIESGYVLVPHPYDARRLSEVDLRVKNVDCIVFWSKNPRPLLKHLPLLEARGYPFLFQFTITPYSSSIEPHLPSRQKRIDTFRLLADTYGVHRMVWRYDPVLIDAAFPVSRHIDAFAELCEALHGHAVRCVFSFADIYRHLGQTVREADQEDRRMIAAGFSAIAAEFGLPLFTCAEPAIPQSFGIGQGACIDRVLIERVVGFSLKARKHRGQRPACGCIESRDIGSYNTCPAGCVYCYATTQTTKVSQNRSEHDPLSSLLVGRPESASTHLENFGSSRFGRASFGNSSEKPFLCFP